METHSQARLSTRRLRRCVSPHSTSSNSLKAFHRPQLRIVINVKFPARISNAALYARTKAKPLGRVIAHARWRMLGHTLRMSESTPPRMAMAAYFAPSNDGAWRGRPRTTLPTVVNADLHKVRKRLVTADDYHQLQLLAQDRGKWSELVSSIMDTYN